MADWHNTWGVPQWCSWVGLDFPSGHTFAGFTVWAAMAIVAWYLLPRRAATPVAAVLLVVGLLQAPARLIVGKHWLSDVVGSWFIGSGWLLLVWAGFLWWLAPRPAATPTPTNPANPANPANPTNPSDSTPGPQTS